MIKINLLGDTTIKDFTGVYQLAGFGAAVALTIGVCIILLASISADIESETARSQSLEIELTNIQKKTTEVRELEAKRKLLREKLAVIATLKRNQSGPVRVMDDLNLALPERAWLKEFKEKDSVLRITGLALDNQTIAAYMKGLEASDYFEKVELIEARQTVWKGAKIKLFTLSCKINYAGKVPTLVKAVDSTVAPGAQPTGTPEAKTAESASITLQPDVG